MKKLYFLLLALFVYTGVNAQIINFPDANFKAKLIGYGAAQDINGNIIAIDLNHDGQIEVNEALNVYKLIVNFYTYNGPYLTDLTGIEYFTNLKELHCSENHITFLNLTSLTNLELLHCNYNQLYSINVSGLTNLKRIDCFANYLTTLNIIGANNIEILHCDSNLLSSLNVSGLTNLKDLSCRNNNLSSLNVSGLFNLKDLDCYANLLPALNLSGLTNLENLNCSANQLTTLDVSVSPNLKLLYCGSNLLTVLDVSMLNTMHTLGVGGNPLIHFDVSGMENLGSLNCANSQLTSLNVSGCKNLGELNCQDNLLTSLDVSGCVNLFQFNCTYNQLVTLNLKNSFVTNYNHYFGFNPTLQYICVDEDEMLDIQYKVYNLGYSNCQVNSYCSFTPGGTFYTIQGDTKLDSNNNGCDVSDLIYPNLNFTITDGTLTGNIISNTSGGYSLPVGQGTHTITPNLENPPYFTISPSTVNVTFPTQTSPFTQNFCITPNGIHHDLEVTLLPTVPARPGFDATYKIIYKNKGTNAQSGSVNLTFDDAVLNFVSANPLTSGQTINNLSWDFINLQPFETREITLTLNVNSPMETPPVNIGYQLNFAAQINPIVADETPTDNTFALKQIVVGSLDPNDKTCLEGTTVSPSMIGEYVHYMIRFENTGTYPAENVVVKDIIDTDKFDINTLVPTKGSHSFVTNITTGNKVEFIFENINLPFDDANNDGYIAFKIKTKPTLVVGDTFTNNANIYFDYNFPIVTNTSTTTIEVLGTQDFEFFNYFTLYPNPAKETLNLSVKNEIEITSINIYNTLGQLVLAIPNAQTVATIDVSKLTAGNYFIKMNTSKGTANTKFIKN